MWIDGNNQFRMCVTYVQITIFLTIITKTERRSTKLHKYKTKCEHFTWFYYIVFFLFVCLCVGINVITLFPRFSLILFTNRTSKQNGCVQLASYNRPNDDFSQFFFSFAFVNRNDRNKCFGLAHTRIWSWNFIIFISFWFQQFFDLIYRRKYNFFGLKTGMTNFMLFWLENLFTKCRRQNSERKREKNWFTKSLASMNNNSINSAGLIAARRDWIILFKLFSETPTDKRRKARKGQYMKCALVSN